MQMSGCSAATSASRLRTAGRDKKPVRRRPGADAEHSPEGVTLRLRDSLEPIQHGSTELVHSRERELHLRLDPGGARYPAAWGVVCKVVQQRGFAHARLPVQDQGLALTVPYRRD